MWFSRHVHRVSQGFAVSVPSVDQVELPINLGYPSCWDSPIYQSLNDWLEQLSQNFVH
jgi:hypothetical protein